MIIGKGGECVARIQKESSAHVQVLQQHEDNSLQERIVTVQGKYREVVLFVTGNMLV